MTHPPSPSRVRCLGAAAAVLFCSFGCESIVGIHASRDVPESGAAPSLGGIDDPAPVDSPAGEPPGTDADPGNVNESGLSSEGPVPLRPPSSDPGGTLPGASGGGGAGSTVPPGEGTPGPDAPPPSDAGSEPEPDDGPPEEPGEEPSEPPGEEPEVCEPAEPPPPPVLQGTAFVFSAGPNSGAPDAVGLCSFPNAELPDAPQFYGAVERELMSGPAALCGACLRARLGSSSVDITIIDVIEANPLARGATLAMDVGALRALSEGGGNLDVQFSFVPCEGAGTIRVTFAGANDPSVSFIGHRHPLSAVRLETSSGASVALTRQEYNYWTPPPGFSHGGGPISLVVDDDRGNRLVLPELEVGSDIDTGRQFPLPAVGCDTAP